MRKKFRAGDLVRVRSKEEILATLDGKGHLKGLPFMPEMFQHCGKQFRVYKRAHKTCDTVNGTGGRWMGDAIHLEGVRCGGESHGGCQAECLIFWWQDWLEEAPSRGAPSPGPQAGARPGAAQRGSTEEQVLAGTVNAAAGSPTDPVYVCQATQLPYYTRLLRWWDLRQYLEDFLSGNASLWRIFCGAVYASYYRFSRTRVGRKLKAEFFYDKFQALHGGLKFPRKQGKVPPGQKSPASNLGLKSGELVRVKSYEEVLATINEHNKNQGLFFDAEMVPYCGQTHRVMKRVSKIIDEKGGKMIHFKNDAIMLEGVYCQSRYSDRRMHCPRAIHSFWREIWLERSGQPTGPTPPGGSAPPEA